MANTFFLKLSSIYHSIIRFFAHHKTYTAFLFVISVGMVLYGFFSQPVSNKDPHTITFGSIKQYVKVSGQVQTSKDANLAFQTTGAVAYVGVRPGENVRQGKVMATLSAGDAQAALLQAEAALASAEAQLSKLEQGARKEELALKEQVLQNTKDSLEQSYRSLPDAIQNVDAVTADVVKNKFSSLFVLNNNRYVLSYASCDQQAQALLEAKRTALENVLADFQKKSSVVTAISSTETVDSSFEAAYQAAFMTNDLVNTISNFLLSPCSISNTSLEQYRVTLSSAKASMTALFADITAKRSSLIVAKNAYNQASRDLELIKAGSDPYTIKAQRAAVREAEARVASARSGLAKTTIVAPFTGVVSNVDLSVGETVSLGKTVISMVATDGYEIEAKVPEIDIVKIKVGAEVQVTLDAYGQTVVFPATVTRVNPTSSTEGTVPVYKVIVTFIGKDERVRQGMTANVQIITESKNNSIVVPIKFVKVLSPTEGEVTIFKDGKETLRTIKLGSRGSDGLVEVKEGLLEGDTVVQQETTSREAQKQTD